MRHRKLVVLATTFVLTLGMRPSAHAADRAAEQKQMQMQVQALFERLMAADKAGDAEAVSRLYEDEGMLLPPSGPPVRGRDEIRKRYDAIFAGTTMQIAMKSEELWVLDGWAISRGITTGRSIPKAGGAARPVHDKYLMVLKRDGDGWVIHNLMWNPMN